MADDDDKAYSKEVLDTLVRVDNVLQSVDSAADVVNAAFFYDDQDLAQKYIEILRDRSSGEKDKQGEEGIG